MIDQDELADLHRYLESGGPMPQLSPDLPAPHRRLARAWAHGSALDVAVLIRHVLRFESENSSGGTQFLLVDGNDQRFASWSANNWSRLGLMANIWGAPRRIRLSAQPWLPDWLDVADESPEAAAFGERPRRTFEVAHGDPAIEVLGRSTFLCPGQKSAVRAVLAMPSGATLLVNLPTGSGKSLCAQVLAAAPFVRDDGSGVVVVVVPTTALCLDQARAVKNLVPYPCAYYEGLAPEERRAIRNRLAAGEQRILFTSPESMMQSLRPALYSAARGGFLRAMVVDEAHMIEQWGDEFRPAFQELAGLRRGLEREAQKHAPYAPRLRTVLLSATWTPMAVETVCALFGEGTMKMSAAVQLRPEPSLWLAPCDGDSVQSAESLRARRVMEALHHLPRPLILYTSKVEDTNWWEKQLRHAGFERLAKMTGQTGSAERARIIEKWATGALDVVVATSAFGLGIDQSEVRAVVHACVPENTDRFYQEVGRGGRDGRASMSLMIYTRVKRQADRRKEEDDLDVARGIGKKRIITLELGLERWKAMFESKKWLGNGLYEMSLHAGRALDMDNSYNRDWNSRTLTLMSRAGVIELDDEPPLERSDSTPASQEQGDDEAVRFSRVVRILDSHHLSEEFWWDKIEQQRTKTEDARKAGWNTMLALLSGRRCAAEILASAYELPAELTRGKAVHVARSCGGCPACRAVHKKPFSHEATPSRFPWEPLHFLGSNAGALFGDESLLVLLYDEKEAQKTLLPRFSRLVAWSIRQGFRGLCAPHEWNNVLTQSQKPLFSSRGVFLLSPHELEVGVPTILFHPPGKDLDTWEKWQRRLASPTNYAPLLLILPSGVPYPERPNRLLSEMATFPCLRLEEWEARVGA